MLIALLNVVHIFPLHVLFLTFYELLAKRSLVNFSVDTSVVFTASVMHDIFSVNVAVFTVQMVHLISLTVAT